jgi:DNA polymerase bacteriophage-type
MPRIDRDKDDQIVPKLTNALRLSLLAPPGKVIMVADLSGIEMRVNHTLWKVPYSMAMWKQNPTADIYKATASRYYHVDESQVDKSQRQFGKVQQLACGFGVGPPKFKDFARTYKLNLTLKEAEAGVWGWRDIHPEIADRETGGWAKCQRALEYIEAGQGFEIDPWGLTYTSKEGVVLPDGRVLRYPDLRRESNAETGREEWKYGKGRHTTYIYGGKMDENIVQALARIVLMDNVIEFWRRTRLRTALRVYDEAVYVVDESEASKLLNELLAIMRTPPKWWPELVTWSEGDVAKSYGLAK